MDNNKQTLPEATLKESVVSVEPEKTLAMPESAMEPNVPTLEDAPVIIPDNQQLAPLSIEGTLEEKPAGVLKISQATESSRSRPTEDIPEAEIVDDSQKAAQPQPKKEEEKKVEAPIIPARPARLETLLTAAVLIMAATGVTWGLARPTTLLFPPTQEQAAQVGQSPDCRRIRFDVAQLLGERWRQTISSCLRGSCENLRESLIARNFPIATWQLLEEDDDSGQGCEVSAQGPAKSAECTRLLGRVEGVAKTVLLQVEGECREQ